MTIGVNSIGSTGGAISPVPLAASVSTNTNGNSSSVAANASGGFHSPRIVQDPSVGYITQYLSRDGDDVLLQTPNKITAAYLRDGLQRDGTRKPTENEPTTSKTA